MHNFEYHRPDSIDEARRVLAKNPDNKPLAGGMSLVPVMRHRLMQPAALVDLGRIVALKGVADEGDRIYIGAMTSHYTVSKADVVKVKIPALVQLAGGIGDPLVRNRGTIGGSLAHNDPAACYPSSILALGATIHTSSRDIGADDFIVGTFTTALEDDEIIVGVTFPVPERAAYIKFINSSSRFSIAGVFVGQREGVVRVGVTGAGHHAFRCTQLEQALSAVFTPEAARSVNISADGLTSDINGSAEYRAHLIPELAARAVEHCLSGSAGAII